MVTNPAPGDRPRDLVLTSASGYTFEQLEYWLTSLDRCGFDGERVVILGRREARLMDRLEARGCQVATREALLRETDPGGGDSFRDDDMSVTRYFLFWKFLCGRSPGETRYVIAADVRDVVFQLNPSLWLAAHINDKRLVVASEGLTYRDQPWNRESMEAAFGPSVLRYMENRLVWNCGTIAGELTAFRDLALNLYLGCFARNVPYSDQASLNVMLSLDAYRHQVLYDDGTLGWACQAGTMVASVRGAELSYRYRGVEPLFDGDTVYTAAGRPFCIVHQYDRVPLWKLVFERKFGRS